MVKIVGIKKSIELFEETKSVEEGGGMLVNVSNFACVPLHLTGRISHLWGGSSSCAKVLSVFVGAATCTGPLPYTLVTGASMCDGR